MTHVIRREIPTGCYHDEEQWRPWYKAVIDTAREQAQAAGITPGSIEVTLLGSGTEIAGSSIDNPTHLEIRVFPAEDGTP